MTGLGLEPRTNGLTYLIGSHRPAGAEIAPAVEVWTLPSPSQACRVESLRLVPAIRWDLAC
jgi:hypothetical protein